MKHSKLSVVIPAFNESKTIALILNKVREVELIDGIGKEVIVVDDCSQDDLQEVIADYQRRFPDLDIRYYRNDRNRGKGYSVRAGFSLAMGDYVIVQDADLEYDPRDYNKLLMPIVEGFADVVYGSRLVSSAPHRILFFWHSIGNHFLTFLSNMGSNLNLTDMETGYKMFRRDVLAKVTLKENRFGFEPEVTAKIARVPGVRIYEVGISYYGRTYKEGKKINWKDGIRALYCIVRYNFLG